MPFHLFNNPVAKKRFSRFKAIKRAYFSLWVMAFLYGISLFSEVICGGDPLLVRYEGRFFFPVVRYYAEDVFTGNGRQTRPDYKALASSPAFDASGENFMVFPPFPHGPYESIDPGAIPLPDEVVLTLTPEPRVGALDVDAAGMVAGAQSADFLDPGGSQSLIGRPLRLLFKPPSGLVEAMALRFANTSAPYAEFSVYNASGKRRVVSLSTYRKRREPPATLRLFLRESPDPREQSISLRVDRNLNKNHPSPPLWRTLSPDQAAMLMALVEKRFSGPVEDFQVMIQGRPYVASFSKAEVRFPYPPVEGHPLGIDAAGRDVLARILYGLRISLTFGLMLTAGSMLMGVAAGAIQGYYAGLLDITAQRLIEIWSALPFLYVMILLGSIYGRSFILLLICYGLFNWVGISYYIRAEFLNLRKRAFVEAAHCMGISPVCIIFRHILPNALTPVVTFFPFSLVGAIGALAALDYLGFGLPPPTPSWGELLFQAQQYRWAWWLITYPSLALFVVMLLGVFVGEGVRNAYDPKPYQRFQ